MVGTLNWQEFFAEGNRISHDLIRVERLARQRVAQRNGIACSEFRSDVIEFAPTGHVRLECTALGSTRAESVRSLVDHRPCVEFGQYEWRHCDP